jgi:hypothetical protein
LFLVRIVLAVEEEDVNVLLVNPEFPETYWSFRHALPFEGKRCVFPPLGLLTVSALLPKSWNRRLVDLNIEKLRTADIEWADMIMATGMLVQKDSLREVVKRAKALGKRVVLGGPYVTSTREQLPPADHLFRGEAETTLPQFVEDLARGEAKAVYEAPERPQLALTPIADFALANMKAYSAMSGPILRAAVLSRESSATSSKSTDGFPAPRATSRCLPSLTRCATWVGADRFSSWTIISSATKRTCARSCLSWRSGRKKMGFPSR